MSAERSSPEEDEDPFGLEVLHELGDGGGTPVQIIFLHGLGGSQKGTWSHPGSTDCWPNWLHAEAGLDNVRIALFGYDANFNVFAPNTNLSIPIFANQLLHAIEQLHYRTQPVMIAHELR